MADEQIRIQSGRVFGCNLREPVSGLTHLVAAVAAALGMLLLLYASRNDAGKALAFFVYGTSLVLMFSASAAYHLVDRGPDLTRRLRKIDHAAIYLLIAGTYTPICLHFFSGFWRWGLLGIIWGMALVGIGLKVFILHAPRWLTAGIYLLMGWLSVMAIDEMLSSMPSPAFGWLLAGGLTFSLGAVVYVSKKPNFYPRTFGFHEVWHLFVIAGCLCHFVVVARYIAL